MRRSEIVPEPEYYSRYIKLVEDEELMTAFDISFKQITGLDINALNEIGDKIYATGKWPVKEILQHITDWERILSYRALLIARKDTTAPAGHDQDLLAMHSCVGRRNIEAILNELKAVRFSTIQMFKSFDEETLLNRGICWQYEVSVLEMGFMIIGHQIHHLKIIKEKYFDL